MDDTIRRFIASVAATRCFLRQRGVHPSFDDELATFERARAGGFVDGRTQSLSPAKVDFIHAWLTDAGRVVAAQGDALAGFHTDRSIQHEVRA